VTCDHADCQAEATVRTRFGDGTWQHGNVIHQQTYAYYCDTHRDTIARLFFLCDMGRVTRKDGSDGPSRMPLPGRHPALGYA